MQKIVPETRISLTCCQVKMPDKDKSLIYIYKISFVLFLGLWLHFICSEQAYFHFRRIQPFLALWNANKLHFCRGSINFCFDNIVYKIKTSYFTSMILTGLKSSIPMTLVMDIGSNRENVKIHIVPQKYHVVVFHT